MFSGSATTTGNYTLSDDVSNYDRLSIVVVCTNNSTESYADVKEVYKTTYLFRNIFGKDSDSNTNYYWAGDVTFSGNKMTINKLERGSGYSSHILYIARVYGYKH